MNKQELQALANLATFLKAEAAGCAELYINWLIHKLCPKKVMSLIGPRWLYYSMTQREKRSLGRWIGAQGLPYAQQWMDQWHELDKTDFTRLTRTLDDLLMFADEPNLIAAGHSGGVHWQFFTRVAGDEQEWAEVVDNAENHWSHDERKVKVGRYHALITTLSW